MREGGVELTRRWVAALVMVSPEDRAGLVAEVESRIAAAYELPRAGLAGLTLRKVDPELAAVVEPKRAAATRKRSAKG